MSIVQDYLDLTKQYQAEYGSKTIVLMEVGSFFEVYALIKPDGSYMGSPIEEFAKINDMVIAKKSNVIVNNYPVVMAGMGTGYAEKYIQKLQDHHYTVVIFKQDLDNKTVRSLSEIISPGTYFPLENENLTNNIMCIWLHKAKATRSLPCQATIGLANIDIYTGKTALFQFQTAYNHSPATYDELERYISAYKPNECLFVANIEAHLIDEIVGFVGLEQTKIHKVSSASGQSASAADKSASAADQSAAKQNNMATFVKNAEKQIYQIEILKKFFPQLSAFPEMFPTHSIALQAFCFLLDFVYQHSPNLVKKLTEPVFENYTDRLILSNHSLSQLNMIDDTRHTGRFKSVISLLNNCVSTMGKRQFSYKLHYPITHKPTLQASYDMTEYLLAQGEPYFLSIRQKLSSLSDLEKFARKVVTRKLLPKNFAAFADDLTHLASLAAILKTDTTIQSYLDKNTASGKNTASDIEATCQTLLADVQRVFNLEVCRNLSDLDETTPIINRGISPVLDTVMKTSMDGADKLNAICNYLSNTIQQSEKKTAAYVKIHETAKSNATLLCTSRRTELLKVALGKQKPVVLLSYKSNYSATTETFEFDLQALEYATPGNNKTDKIITSKQIREITSENETNKTKLVKEMWLVFQNYLTEFAQFEEPLAALICYATELDMLQGKAYTAHKYNYCKPVLGTGEQAYFDFTGIRHPLIEHLQTQELYVTNDMALGTVGDGTVGDGSAKSGVLLYGTNAVGKTSFIKSVGIAIIMAQAGLYVPCNSLTYNPYRAIFTRILGNDNLFKGLSTFAVEMTELRTILTLADAHSLVLGDELCSGTESDSALSIFTAGLEILHERASTFIFATHFHEINKYEEITRLSRLKMLHMAVHFNQETNTLVYDRKLREGPGESMYGLEVCKSLNLPAAFLQRAHAIRMKYQPEKQNVLALTPTAYNAKKLGGNCEICQQKASEVHHLQHQKNAQANDYITNTAGQNFHKNHVANLLNICEACHKTLHAEKAEHKVVKTSQGYRLAKV